MERKTTKGRPIQRQVFLGKTPAVHQDWSKLVCSSCYTLRDPSVMRCPVCNELKTAPLNKTQPIIETTVEEFLESQGKRKITYECKDKSHPKEHRVYPVLAWRENRQYRMQLWAKCPECGKWLRHASQALIDDMNLLKKPDQVPKKPNETPSLFGED